MGGEVTLPAAEAAHAVAFEQEGDADESARRQDVLLTVLVEVGDRAHVHAAVDAVVNDGRGGEAARAVAEKRHEAVEGAERQIGLAVAVEVARRRGRGAHVVGEGSASGEAAGPVASQHRDARRARDHEVAPAVGVEVRGGGHLTDEVVRARAGRERPRAVAE